MATGRGQPSSQDPGRVDGADELAELFSAFARSAQQEKDPRATLIEVVRAAIAVVPGCDEASISVVLGRRKVTSEAASGDLPRRVDALQQRFQQGPCIDAAYEHVTVRVADMASEKRWPRFSPAALAGGAAGMLSIQLYVEGDDLGALNLYSRSAGAFTDESEHVGLMFAAHAAVAYAAATHKARAARNLLTQQLIGQAQGILMERHKITSDDAFTLLVRASQDSNLKLRDLASRLAMTGELSNPDGPDRPADPGAAD